MTGKGHIVVGAAATVATVSAFDYPLSAEFAFAMLIGVFAALLPDIDSAESTLKGAVRAKGQPVFVQTFLGKAVPRNLLLKIIYLFFGTIEFLVRAAIVRVMNVASVILPHRGITHYPAVAALLTYLLYRVSLFFGWSLIFTVAFAAGYLSHIFADSITRSGVPLFGPLTKRRFRLLPKRFCLRTKRGMDIYERLYALLIVGVAAYIALFV